MTPVVEPAAGAFGLHPIMFPVIDANRKRAKQGGVAHAPGNTKSVIDVVVTAPVGKLPGIVMVAGLGLRTNGLPDTSPLKSWLVPVPLFATQNGLDAVAVTPQGFTSNGSRSGASPGTSDT